MGDAYPWANRNLTTRITHSIFELSRQKKNLRIRLDELYDIMTAAHAVYGDNTIKTAISGLVWRKKWTHFFC